MSEKFGKLEEFVVEALAKEIAEFHEDKKDLAETKVRLIREAKKHTFFLKPGEKRRLKQALAIKRVFPRPVERRCCDGWGMPITASMTW